VERHTYKSSANWRVRRQEEMRTAESIQKGVLLSACGAQRHTFIFGPKRGKPGGAASWLGVEAKKGERIIPRSCPARFRLMFCSIVGFS
jgi:hypothetical protein